VLVECFEEILARLPPIRSCSKGSSIHLPAEAPHTLDTKVLSYLPHFKYIYNIFSWQVECIYEECRSHQNVDMKIRSLLMTDLWMGGMLN
jgi:hypothetical protein